MEKRSSVTTLTFNGKTYHSAAEMPADVRQAYQAMIGKLIADKNGDGVADVMQGRVEDQPKMSVQTSKHYVVNGRRYESLDAMPPEVREAFTAARSGGRVQGRNMQIDSSPGSGGVSWMTLLLIFAVMGLAVVAAAWVAGHR
jgi:hypothetical protein